MEELKALVLRIFRTGSLSRVFSVTRFLFLLVGFSIAAVWFAFENVFISIGFALTAFVLYRYGQIKGYIK
jgi:hypothetical protein